MLELICWFGNFWFCRVFVIIFDNKLLGFDLNCILFLVMVLEFVCWSLIFFCVFWNFFKCFLEYVVMEVGKLFWVFFVWIFVIIFLLLRFICMFVVFSWIDLWFLVFVFLVFVCFFVVKVFGFDDCMMWDCWKRFFYMLLLLVVFLFWDGLVGGDVVK